jgi:hypothetical protein
MPVKCRLSREEIQFLLSREHPASPAKARATLVRLDRYLKMTALCKRLRGKLRSSVSDGHRPAA